MRRTTMSMKARMEVKGTPGKVGGNSAPPEPPSKFKRSSIDQELYDLLHKQELSSKPMLISNKPAANDSYSNGGDGLLQDSCPELWAWLNNNRPGFCYVELKDKERHIKTSKSNRRSAEKIIRDPRLYQRQPKVVPPSKVAYRWVNPCPQFSLSKADSTRAIAFGIGEADKYFIEALTSYHRYNRHQVSGNYKVLNYKKGEDPNDPKSWEEKVVFGILPNQLARMYTGSTEPKASLYDDMYHSSISRSGEKLDNVGRVLKDETPTPIVEKFVVDLQKEKEYKQLTFAFFKRRRGAMLGLTEYLRKLKPKYKGKPGLPKPEYWDENKPYFEQSRAHDEIRISQRSLCYESAKYSDLNINAIQTIGHLPTGNYLRIPFSLEFQGKGDEVRYEQWLKRGSRAERFPLPFKYCNENAYPRYLYNGSYPKYEAKLKIDPVTNQSVSNPTYQFTTVKGGKYNHTYPVSGDILRHVSFCEQMIAEHAEQWVSPGLDREVGNAIKNRVRLVLGDKKQVPIEPSTRNAFKKDINKALFYDNRHLFKQRHIDKSYLRDVYINPLLPKVEILQIEHMNQRDLTMVKGCLGPGLYEEIMSTKQCACPACGK